MNIIDSFLKLTNMPDYYNYAHYLTLLIFNALDIFCLIFIWERLLVRKHSKLKTFIYANLVEQPLIMLTFPFFMEGSAMTMLMRILYHLISVASFYKGNKKSFSFYAKYIQGIFLMYSMTIFMALALSSIAVVVYEDFSDLIMYFSSVLSPGFFTLIAINIVEVGIGTIISIQLLRIFERIKGSRSFKQKSGLMLLPIYQIMIFAIMLNLYTEEVIFSAFSMRIHGGILVSVLLSVIVDIWLYKTLGIIERKSQLEHQLDMIEQLQNAGYSEYKQLELNYRKERMFHHDINDKLIAIRGLMAQGHQNEAAGLMDELSRSVSFHKKYCENPLVNILLENKISYASQMDIDFEVNASVDELSIKKTDLCSVVSNILDNAIEACSSLPKEVRRLILLDIHMEKSYFIISCKNPCGSEAREHRPDRGHGLIILQQIADAYEGRREIKRGDGRFEITVVLLDGFVEGS